MRKLKRSIARANMIKAGHTRINKKIGNKGERKTSFFASHWREYV